MRRKGYGLLLVLIGLVATALPALAHHSFTAEFNGDKEFVVKGVLTKFEWINPHVYYHLDVTEPDGKVDSYTFESGPPSVLHRAGFRKEDVIIGDHVTITAAPAKDGNKKLGWMKMIKYSDGHVFVYRNGSE